MPDSGAEFAFVFCEPNSFISEAVFSFSGIPSVLCDGCGSEVCFSIVQAVAIDMVDDKSFGDMDELAVHEDA